MSGNKIKIAIFDKPLHTLKNQRHFYLWFIKNLILNSPIFHRHLHDNFQPMYSLPFYHLNQNNNY